MKKWIKLTILLFTISSIILLQNSFTVTTKANSKSNGIITYSDNIEWRYKSIDGKLHKRLYNTTTKKWIGNWIPV